ncbi:MAG: efflux transporter outer membrane subunit [Burkholderiaceae bacterium]|nr:efflux transporter outer membrane subunit [Burkholderiaceae bacterium]
MLIAGCATTPLPAQRALPELPAAFERSAGDSQAVAAPAADGAWWRCFDDPVLDELVGRALSGNGSIEQAVARVQRARAAVRSGEAARGPQVGVHGGVIGPSNTSAGDQVADNSWAGVGVRMSYDLDLFERSAPSRQAALADAAVAQATLSATHLVVQADTVHTYLALRALEAERSLLEEDIAGRAEALQIAQRQWRKGLISERPLAGLERDLASARADAAVLDRRQQELSHALAILVGEVPTSWRLPPASVAWPGALPNVPAGIPGEVLARRPDLASSGSAVRAAQARVGVAQSTALPHVTLTATGGIAAQGLGDLIRNASRMVGFGLLLDLPVFDSGRREAATQAAIADLEQAAAAHRERVLVSLREVEDQLSALQAAQRQADATAPALAAATRTRETSTSRAARGLAARPEVLESRHLEIQQQRAALQIDLARRQGTVALIRALGGGWSGSAG